MPDECYQELARRIFAAVLSYRMGMKSIDYTMKNYLADEHEMHPSWVDLAKRIDQFLSERLTEDLFKQPTKNIH